MAVFGIIIILLACMLSFAAFAWLVVVSFQESVGWGLITLLVPGGALVFVIMHWDIAQQPFIANICSVPVLIIGMAFIWSSVPTTRNATYGGSYASSARTAPSAGVSAIQQAPSFPTSAQFPSDYSWPSATPSQSPVSTKPTRKSAAPATFEADNILRGDAYNNGSIAKLPEIQYRSQDIIASEIRGEKTGTKFKDTSPAGGILIGLRLGVENESIMNIRPIYQVGSKCSYGERHGPDGGQKYEVVAKPGYALAGIIITVSGFSVNSLQAIFLRVKTNGELDMADRYTSDVVGAEIGIKRRVYAETRPVAEIFGFTQSSLTSIGLGAVELSPPNSASAIASAAPPKQARNFGSVPQVKHSQPSTKPPVTFGSAARPAEAALDESQPSSNLAPSKVVESSPEASKSVENNIPAAKPTEEPLRTWKDAKGKNEMEAKFQSFDGETVRLEGANHDIYRIDINQLSEADRDYVRSRPSK
jgi:hypothetical protein